MQSPPSVPLPSLLAPQSGGDVVGIILSGDKLKFKCVVPVIAFVLLPVAVDSLIVVGVSWPAAALLQAMDY